MMRLLRAVSLALVLFVVTVSAVTAAPEPTCPTRSAVIDSVRGSVALSDIGLILSFGGLVGLAASAWGAPGGVVAALLGAGVATTSGLRALVEIDAALQDNVAVMAERLSQNPDELAGRVHYGEQIVAGNWLMRVAGATVGSLVGLATAPVGLRPLIVPSRVLLTTAGGVAAGSLWHRYALWPFFDGWPGLCQAGSSGLRT